MRITYTGSRKMSVCAPSRSRAMLCRYAICGTGENNVSAAGPYKQMPDWRVTAKCAARSQSVPYMVRQNPGRSAAAFAAYRGEKCSSNGVGYTKFRTCSSRTTLISSPLRGASGSISSIYRIIRSFCFPEGAQRTTTRKSTSLVFQQNPPRASDPCR